MSKFFCPLCFFILSTSVLAQPTIQWQKTLGGTDYEEVRSVQLTTDGGFIVAGTALSDDGDVGANYGIYDAWVVRLDSTGTVVWKKNYGGSNFDQAYSIQQTPDGGFVVAGNSESNDGDVSGNHGDEDAWVLKLDSEGNVQWQKCLGGSKRDRAWNIQLTPDGGYVMIGESRSTDGDVTGNHGVEDYWVVKLSATAQIEWQKSLGGSDFDHGYTISTTSDGGYIVAGEAQSNDGDVINLDGGLDAWVVKLNFEGKILWQRALGGTLLDRANEIHQTREGGYILFGGTLSNDGDVTGNHGGNDMWAVKLSENGNIEWQRALGGTSEEYGQSIQQTVDGGFIATGFVNSNNGDITGNHGGRDLWVIKLSEGGNLLWQKTYGGTSTDRGLSIKQTSDQGYIVAGDTWSNNGDINGNHGSSDFWIVKLSPEATPTSAPQSQPLTISPNPATQSITLNIPTETSTLKVRITDLVGRELKKQSVLNNGTMDVSALPNGLYLVTATARSGQVYIGKLRKEG